MPDPNIDTPLDIDTLLCERRLLMVGGKGGVGKTAAGKILQAPQVCCGYFCSYVYLLKLF